MKLKNLNLKMENVFSRISNGHIELADVTTNFARNEDGTKKVPEEIASYSLELIANRGDLIKIKVPPEAKEKVAQVKSALNDAENLVLVELINPTFLAYAMPARDGRFPISGVSGRADDFCFKVQTIDDEIVIDA